MTDRAILLPLLDLQRVDSAITRAQKRQRELPEELELAQLIEEHGELAPILEERRASYADLQRQQKKIEGDVEALRIRIKREEDRLASGTVTSPREIVALQAEIDSLTRRIATHEDDELALMEQAEAVQVQIDEVAAQVGNRDELVGAVTERRDRAAAEIAAELAVHETDRSALVAAIDPGLVDTYVKTRDRLGGIAVASFDGTTCGGCGLPLSPLEREEFRASAKLIVTCETCRRILIPTV